MFFKKIAHSEEWPKGRADKARMAAWILHRTDDVNWTNRIWTNRMFDTPLALMIFNRPDLTQGLLDCVRPIRPRRLFVVADAARQDRPEEAEQVQQTRRVIDQIDWPCEVTRIFAEQNLGCGLRIHSGISEAFQQVDRLIVLEDDCRPDPSFFHFAQCMLGRYEQDCRIMAVGGTCFHDRVPTGQSYYFSRYAHCWGWGTWRRAWRLYDESVSDWTSVASSKRYAQLFSSKHEAAYWTHLLDRIACGKLDTWDVQWLLTCWLNEGLTILPTKNLVRNVGFGANATHTTKDSPWANLPVDTLNEIVHPQTVTRAHDADAESDRLLFSGTWKRPGLLKTALQHLQQRLYGRGELCPGNRGEIKSARAA